MIPLHAVGFTVSGDEKVAQSLQAVAYRYLDNLIKNMEFDGRVSAVEHVRWQDFAEFRLTAIKVPGSGHFLKKVHINANSVSKELPIHRFGSFIFDVGGQLTQPTGVVSKIGDSWVVSLEPYAKHGHRTGSYKGQFGDEFFSTVYGPRTEGSYQVDLAPTNNLYTRTKAVFNSIDVYEFIQSVGIADFDGTKVVIIVTTDADYDYIRYRPLDDIPGSSFDLSDWPKIHTEPVDPVTQYFNPYTMFSYSAKRAVRGVIVIHGLENQYFEQTLYSFSWDKDSRTLSVDRSQSHLSITAFSHCQSAVTDINNFEFTTTYTVNAKVNVQYVGESLEYAVLKGSRIVKYKLTGEGIDPVYLTNYYSTEESSTTEETSLSIPRVGTIPIRSYSVQKSSWARSDTGPNPDKYATGSGNLVITDVGNLITAFDMEAGSCTYFKYSMVPIASNYSFSSPFPWQRYGTYNTSWTGQYFFRKDGKDFPLSQEQTTPPDPGSWDGVWPGETYQHALNCGDSYGQYFPVFQSTAGAYNTPHPSGHMLLSVTPSSEGDRWYIDPAEQKATFNRIYDTDTKSLVEVIPLYNAALKAGGYSSQIVESTSPTNTDPQLSMCSAINELSDEL